MKTYRFARCLSCLFLAASVVCGSTATSPAEDVFFPDDVPQVQNASQPKTLPPPLTPVPPKVKPPLGTEKPKPPKPLPTVPAFRDTELGAHATLGEPWDGGVGYKHYDYPSYRYDLWYRPRPFGWGIAERCAPSPFRPRGYGNLFNEQSTCYRMDYLRYVLTNHYSEYGPAYYRLQPDQRCDHCDKSQYHLPDCDRCRTYGGKRRTSVWTLGRHHHD